MVNFPGHPPISAAHRRINVVGTSGSGKTTMAANLATRLQLPHVEMDALYWNADWEGSPDPVFRERVAAALASDSWVIDGNYSRVRDIVWGRAQAVVWLDYALPIIMEQLLWRSVRRALTREELWGGNRESWCRSFFSRDSILVWALQSYKRRRRQYPQLLVAPEHAHLAVAHLRSPAQARHWLASL